MANHFIAPSALALVLSTLMIGGCPDGATDTSGADAAPTGAAAGDSGTAGTLDENGAVADELIVSVAPGADRDDLNTLYDDLGLTLRDRLDALLVDLLAVDPDSKDQVRDALDDSPLVEDVNDNVAVGVELTPDDPIYPIQWHLEATGAPAAWQITTGSEQILVAVLDTGVDTDHIDLKTKLRGGGNTFDGQSGWEDMIGHGTEVAGVIGAVADNAAGVASVAPLSPILPIRVTADDGTATSWSIAAGIALAVHEGARVINISFAPLYDDDIVMRQARLARLAGALVIIASDNSGELIEGGGSDAVCFVGAIDRDETLAGFSTYGDFVDLVAPGVSIHTTRRDDRFGSSSGTSLAAPIVSGVAALIWSINPDLRPSTVQAILITTAVDLGEPGDDPSFGAGRVDAFAAVELAQAIQEQIDTTAPTISIRKPADQATVGGTIAIDVDVSDDSDLADVTLALDSTVLASDATSPYAFVLNTGKHSVGEHTVVVTATDVFGNAAQQQVTLIFSGPPDATPPGVSIVSPTEGAVLSGTITIIADATDDRALVRADVLIDNVVVGTIAISGAETRVAFNLDTSDKNVPSGSRTLTVRVFDATGNQRTAAVGITIQK